MTCLESFIKSKAWNSEYGLPLVPGQNPHFFLALCNLILKSNGEQLDIMKVFDFQRACFIEPGLYKRWPDGSGGNTSHDELIGISYFSGFIPAQIVQYLNRTDGIYNPLNEPTPYPERWNLNRFIWAIAYMRARAGYRLGPLFYFDFILNLLIDLWTYNPKKEIKEDSRLMIWLMAQEMKRFPLISLVQNYWIKKMERYGVNPKSIFKTYLADFPEFREWAPDKFFLFD